MISITRDEAMALREEYGNDICIAITNRHKHGGRKKYYLAEERRFIYSLNKIRSRNLKEVYTKKKRGD